MFRFTIRELILVTTVAALGTAWWIDHKSLSTQLNTPTELWQRRSDALAGVLKDEGWNVSWKGNAIDCDHEQGRHVSIFFLPDVEISN